MAAVLSRPWKRPTRRSSSLLTVQSVRPVTAVAPAARMPAGAEHARGVESAAGGRVAVDQVEHRDACLQPDGQVAQGRVQRVPDPPAAVQQLNDQVVLMPFAQWHQHPGQPVAQGPEPAEPVEPGGEVAVPVDQPGGRGRGTGSLPGLLARCWRIAGLVAA